MSKDNKNIVIAAGGTGGHIFPAVSLMENLNKIGFISILTTDSRGLKFIDKKIVQKTITIKSSSLNREKKFISVLTILQSIFRSLIILFKVKPKFIFGMGGYASFPICLAGVLLRIPIIIYENNLLIGKTNRFLAPFAKRIFVTYKDIQGINTQHKNKTIVVGNIIRENILNFSKSNDYATSNDLNILVLGGSQAAKIFAEKLPDIFVHCKKKTLILKCTNNV